jgi:hypothetical protein
MLKHVGKYYMTTAGVLQVAFEAFDMKGKALSKSWLARHASLTEMPEGGVLISKKIYNKYEK